MIKLNNYCFTDYIVMHVDVLEPVRLRCGMMTDTAAVYILILVLVMLTLIQSDRGAQLQCPVSFDRLLLRLGEPRIHFIWTYSFYLNLFIFSGPFHFIWTYSIRTYSFSLDLFILSGPIHSIWTCSFYLDLFILSGPIHSIWTYSFYQDLYILSGPIHSIWTYQCSRERPYFGKFVKKRS